MVCNIRIIVRSGKSVMGKILTVSIAAYNVENYLRECLDSFLENTVLERCEVIIVDDGSTDNTGNIANEYVGKYPQTFTYIKKENGGWGSTLNVSIQKAKGKYFKQLDGDDTFDTRNLAEYICQLERVESDVVITPYIEFYDNDGSEKRRVVYAQNIERKKKLEIENITEVININMHAATFKTEILKQNGVKITEHCFYTDEEFVVKALNFSDTITFIDAFIYRYRIARAGQSVSLEGYRKHYKENLYIVQSALEVEKLSNKKNPLLERKLQSMVFNLYGAFFKIEITKEHKDELKAYDSFIKEKYPQYYYAPNIDKSIVLLRKSHFMLYGLLAWRIQRKCKI